MLSFFSVLDIKLKITITFELNFCFQWVKWETAHDLILLIFFYRTLLIMIMYTAP